jgi:hypothetical protein
MSDRFKRGGAGWRWRKVARGAAAHATQEKPQGHGEIQCRPVTGSDAGLTVLLPLPIGGHGCLLAGAGPEEPRPLHARGLVVAQVSLPCELPPAAPLSSASCVGIRVSRSRRCPLVRSPLISTIIVLFGWGISLSPQDYGRHPMPWSS